jgi:MoxR-like ATPase
VVVRTGTKENFMTTMVDAPSANGTAPATPVVVEPSDYLRVARFLDTEVLVERATEVRVLILTLLSGTNVLLIGSGGTAKTLALDELAKCIVGARYFKKVMNEELAPSAILGGYDYARFMKTGELVRKTVNMAPDSHIFTADELFRANGMMLDAQLPITNVGEREAEVEGVIRKLEEFLMYAAATNFIPDADNVRAQAFMDRMTNMLYVQRVQAADSFKEIIRRHTARLQAHANGTALKRETITLAQALEAQKQVRNVRDTPEFMDSAVDLRQKAITEGVDVSDRRWMEVYLMCRANAWLNGRDHLIPEDLVVAEYGMARAKDQVGTAHALVLPFHGRFERAATELRQEAVGPITEVEQVRPLVEGTPPNEDIDPDVLRKALNASRKIDAAKGRVDEVLAEAEQEKRDAATLRDLANELLAMQMWFKKNSLPTQYEG